MTDLLDTGSEDLSQTLSGADNPVIEEPGEFAATLKGRTCKEPGCDGAIADGASPATKYCPEHFRGNGGRAKRRREGNTGERPPASAKVNVNVGGARATGGKKDQQARDTADGARAFMQVVGAGLAMTGDQVCGMAVQNGAAQWGEAVGELSKFQPWLSSIFAPAGGNGQIGAWLGFLMATGAIALPVLAHHGMLPDAIGVKMAGVMVAADGIDQQPTAA